MLLNGMHTLLHAHVQVRRLLRGDFNGQGAVGAAVVTNHVQYKQQYLQSVQQLAAAQNSGDFNLEEHGVELIRSRQMQVFRRCAHTLGSAQRSVLNLGE